MTKEEYDRNIRVGTEAVNQMIQDMSARQVPFPMAMFVLSAAMSSICIGAAKDADSAREMFLEWSETTTKLIEERSASHPEEIGSAWMTKQ